MNNDLSDGFWVKRRPSRMRMPVFWGACGIALIAYLLLATGVIWTRVPIADEAFYAIPAYNLLMHGFMGTTGMEFSRPFPGLERYTYTYPPVYPLLTAAWYKLVGFGLHAVRFPSTLSGLVALGAWFVIIRKTTGELAPAVLGMCLLALDYTFLMSATLGRPDMMSSAFGACALAAYLHLRERDLRLALLVSHAFAVAAGLTLPPAGILFLPSLILATFYLDRRRIRWAHLPIIAIPYLAGAAGWGIYILQEPSLFLPQFLASVRHGNRLGGAFLPWTALAREIGARYLVYYGVQSGKVDPRILLLPIYVGGVLVALCTPGIRRHRGCRLLMLMAGLHFAILTFFENTKQRPYLIHIMPFAVVLMAIWLEWCWRNRSRFRPLLAAAVAVMLFLHVGMVAYRIWLRPYQKFFAPVAQYLRTLPVDKELVMASLAINFGVGFDKNVLQDGNLGYFSAKKPVIIVVNDEIRLYFRSHPPQVTEHSQRLLTRDFCKVFEHADYEVYVRRSACIPHGFAIEGI